MTGRGKKRWLPTVFIGCLIGLAGCGPAQTGYETAGEQAETSAESGLSLQEQADDLAEGNDSGYREAFSGEQAENLLPEQRELILCYMETYYQGLAALDGPLQDPARLTLDTGGAGVDGGEAAEFFRSRGCEPEYADGRYVVFILTPFNAPAERVRLREAIRGMAVALRRGRFLGRGARRAAEGEERYAAYAWDGTRPEAVCSPREALLAPCEMVPAEKAAGRVAARTACPCPPGIAAVVPGERITEETAVRLKQAGFDHLAVLR